MTILNRLTVNFRRFFCRLKAHGYSTLAAVNWAQTLGFLNEDCIDHSQTGTDSEVTDFLADALVSSDADITFVHLDAPDYAGHHGAFSLEYPEYRRAVEDSERHVARLMQALHRRPNIDNEHWMVIVTTDHGGHLDKHTGRTPEVLTIPLIIASAGLQSGEIGVDANRPDVVPTVLDFFQLPLRPFGRLDGVSRWNDGRGTPVDVPIAQQRLHL